MIVAGVVACLALGARIEGGQSRFEATDTSDLTGVPGLRVIDVRDNLLKTCYVLFVVQPADPAGAASRVEYADIGSAAAVRDQRLGDLLLGFEHERGAIPGTVVPNPLRYQWQADSAQIDFALIALNNAFARLEQELTRASRTAVTAVPQPCAVPQRPAP
jgi:hypothetical protein